MWSPSPAAFLFPGVVVLCATMMFNSADAQPTMSDADDSHASTAAPPEAPYSEAASPGSVPPEGALDGAGALGGGIPPMGGSSDAAPKTGSATASHLHTGTVASMSLAVAANIALPFWHDDRVARHGGGTAAEEEARRPSRRRTREQRISTDHWMEISPMPMLLSLPPTTAVTQAVTGRPRASDATVRGRRARASCDW